MEYKNAFKNGFIVGAVAGALGAYVVFKKHEKVAAKLWMLHVKGDLHRRLKEVKRLSKDNYEELVDNVLARYRSAEHIARHELDDFRDELKRRWKEVKREFDEGVEAELEKD